MRKWYRHISDEIWVEIHKRVKADVLSYTQLASIANNIFNEFPRSSFCSEDEDRLNT